jgi:hypothetical protein
MKLNPELANRKLTPSYEEACNRPPHKWRNDFWLVCYAKLHRGMGIWMAVFLLLFCLLGALLAYPWLLMWEKVRP